MMGRMKGEEQLLLGLVRPRLVEGVEEEGGRLVLEDRDHQVVEDHERDIP